MMTGSSGFEEAVCTFDFEIMRPSYLVMLCIASIGGLCFVRPRPPPSPAVARFLRPLSLSCAHPMRCRPQVIIYPPRAYLRSMDLFLAKRLSLGGKVFVETKVDTMV